MEFPRPLRPIERDVLDIVLPSERAGYREIRDRIVRMIVLSEGRRGDGDLVLGFPGDTPDLSSPLTAVVAYGVLETTAGSFLITVREEAANQINVEIVSERGERLPDQVEEKRRWTYSRWSPGEASPSTGGAVREVNIGDAHTLVCDPSDRRLWLYDAHSGLVCPLPITGFYSELMLSLGIRDPATVFRTSLFWERLPSYPDEQLKEAFVRYNHKRHRADLTVTSEVPDVWSMGSFVRRIFRRRL